MSGLQHLPPVPSILREITDISVISLLAEQRYFPQRDVTIQEEILMTPNFTHFRHLIAQEAYTKSLLAIESLEETFEDATVKSISAMSTWWTELQNESASFKARLEQTKTAGTPIGHLREYILNVQKIDSLIFSSRSQGEGHGKSPKVLDVIAPVGFVIKKLGRKVSRMSTTLRNQIIVLERAANDLVTNWGDNLSPSNAEDDGKFNFMIQHKLNRGIEDSEDSTIDLPAQHQLMNTMNAQRLGLTRWQKIRRFVLCSKGITTAPSSCTTLNQNRMREYMYRSSRKLSQYSLPKITDGIPRDAEHSFTSASLTPISDILMNKTLSGEVIQIPDKNEEIDPATIERISQVIPQASTSNLARTESSCPAPISNANSKTNWLSRSTEDFNNTSDSEPETCETVTTTVKNIEPISELEAFMDKLVRGSMDVELNQNLKVAVNPAPVDIEDDRSAVLERGRSSSIVQTPTDDYMTPLKEFTQHLNRMIVTVTVKCRNMELGFFDSKLKNAWCLPRAESKEIGDVIKLLTTTSENLGDPILADEISDGDKAHMTQKLESMLRAGGKCLHAIKDLNNVVNAERKIFKDLVQFCSGGGCKKEQSN